MTREDVQSHTKAVDKAGCTWCAAYLLLLLHVCGLPRCCRGRLCLRLRLRRRCCSLLLLLLHHRCLLRRRCRRRCLLLLQLLLLQLLLLGLRAIVVDRLPGLGHPSAYAAQRRAVGAAGTCSMEGSMAL